MSLVSKTKQLSPLMKKGILFSGIFHFVLLLAVFVDFPDSNKKNPIFGEPIPVEVIVDKIEEKPEPEVKPKPVEEKVVKNTPPPKPIPKEPPEEKKVVEEPKVPTPPEPKQVKNTPPARPDLKESADMKAPLPRARTRKPPPPPPVEKKQEQPAKKPPQQPKKPVEAKQNDGDFVDFLDNLTEAEKEPPKQPDQTKRQPQQSILKGQTLTKSENDSLQRQIKKNWNMPPGAKNTDVLVAFHIDLDDKGNVLKVKTVKTSGSLPQSIINATEASAKRAIFRSSPLKLPQDKLSIMQTIEIIFTDS